ncbi:MAG TPA: hypothetical protein PKX91_05415 [Clostridia bacterium]|nr:hypothetical protein [Clostridia bacterium]
MKNLLVALGAIVIVVLLSSIAFIACTPANTVDTSLWDERVDADYLYNDARDYVDYAKEVDWDYEQFPYLNECGLFWYSWDSDTKKLSEDPADSELGASYIDPNKPTVIFIPGMQMDGYLFRNDYSILKALNPVETLGLTELSSTDKVYMPYLWLKQGWNVGMFHWERFSSGEAGALLELPPSNEERIWAVDGETRDRHVDPDGEAHFGATDYCIAEHFAAEYIRAMNLLPDSMGKEEIRLVAHSMGGEVVAAGLFLLTELSHPKVNQISVDKLPNRYALVDTYFSTVIKRADGEDFIMGPEDITVRWSGKTLPEGKMQDTIFACLKLFKRFDIAMEYISYRGSFLLLSLNKEYMREFLKYATVIDAKVDWSELYSAGGLTWGTSWELECGHVAMLYLYCSSIAAGNSLDITNPDVVAYAPTAALPTEDLKKCIGKYYQLTEGNTSFNMAEHKYTQPGVDDLIEFLLD